MGGHKRKESRRIIKSDRKINQKNKNLMIEKILSYNPGLVEGIEIYKDANRNFMLLIFLGVLLVNFPLISVPCCVLSMFFIIKMLQFIRYKSINNIVKELAKDLSFKGIYDRGKVEDMLDDFRTKYGEDVIEYSELVAMIEKYENFVIKIECILKNINIHEEENVYSKVATNKRKAYLRKNDRLKYGDIKGNQNKTLEQNYYFDETLSVLYKKENGEIKKVNKAIELFDIENIENNNSENAIILKNVNKENKNLTVYLYKKSSALQKNAL